MLDKDRLLGELSPSLDGTLTGCLVDEFISLERRYVLCDWEPATLDGGQFVEVASRIVYHVDSGNVNRRKGVDSCLTYVEDEKCCNQHAFPKRRTALHLCKVLRTVYKFRSQRGAVHIDPDYSANEMDTALVMSNVRWIMAELLRVFWSGDRAAVARAIREIVRFDIPAVLSLDDRRIVLRTDCTAEEEIMILLYNAGEDGMSRQQLGKSVMKSAPSISQAVRRLISTGRREVTQRANGQYVLLPPGTRRVREELGDKLTLTS